ncbi:hypothetical protein UFOVP1596_19 [uncultured Caudovirales phage]|uniref:Uncharacterized protein n=1 Tax=uncultured Caudovirales phage TaxID=2100421 RepID=A0A6J5SVD8_9CAUD|nr:hypothetical protein UFOVP1596_19 [uncultured Caudovirales phage]
MTTLFNQKKKYKELSVNEKINFRSRNTMQRGLSKVFYAWIIYQFDFLYFNDVWDHWLLSSPADYVIIHEPEAK